MKTYRIFQSEEFRIGSKHNSEIITQYYLQEKTTDLPNSYSYSEWKDIIHGESMEVIEDYLKYMQQYPEPTKIIKEFKL